MPLPGRFFVFLAAVVGAYLVCVEFAKRRLLRRYAGRPPKSNEPARCAGPDRAGRLGWPQPREDTGARGIGRLDLASPVTARRTMPA